MPWWALLGLLLPHGATQRALLGLGKAGKVVYSHVPPIATRKSRVKPPGCTPIPPGWDVCCFFFLCLLSWQCWVLTESSFPNQLYIYKPEARAAYPHPRFPLQSFPLGTRYGSGWSLGCAFFKAQCSLLTKALLMANAERQPK